MTIKNPTVAQLLAQLAEEKVLTTHDQDTLKRLAKKSSLGDKEEEFESWDIMPQVEETTPTNTPWYIKGLIGMSAWLSSLFMILFLALARILNEKASGSFLFTGAMFLGLAFILYTSQRRSFSIFFNQFALSMAMTGRILVTIGFFLLFKKFVPAATGVVVMELVVMALYPDSLQRFISTFVTHCAMLLIFATLKRPRLTYVYIALMTLLIRTVWVRMPALKTERLRELLTPMGHATAAALLAVTAFSTTPLTSKILAIQTWLPVTVVVAAMWLLIGTDIAKDYHVSPTDKLFLVGGITLLLFCATAYNAPGITTACFVMTVGFFRKESVLVGLSIVSLIAFVGFYYYGLQISLLMKSVALLVPGILLIVARTVFHKLASEPNVTPA